MSYPPCIGVCEQRQTRQLKRPDPFLLVHDAKSVLLVEIAHEAPKVSAYEETVSTKALQDDIDALDEARGIALAKSMKYQ
jgi:hypothetical protein